MSKIIYLHGFNSAYNPQSDKVKELQTIGTVTGVSYNSYGSYDEIFRFLIDNIEYCDDLVLVGTSLGGFWAATIAAHLGCPSVVINPCHTPESMLARYVGIANANYQTGQVNTLTSDAVSSYARHKISTNAYPLLPLVLLDMGDSVIDSSETATITQGYPMMQFEGGSHMFEHMSQSIDRVAQYINYCEFVEQSNI